MAKANPRRPRKPTDATPFDYCDGCRRTSETTVCGICLHCATSVIVQRRKMFSRSEGNVLFSRQFQLPNHFKEAIR